MAAVRNVWLPSARVWACMPQTSDGGRCDDAAAGSRKRRREMSPGDEDEDHGASSSQDVMCPICLGSIEHAEEAVLQWCMHRFCTRCIEEWSKVRRACPLCKAEFRGWYHGVQSDNQFHELVLPRIAPPRVDFASSFRSWRNSRRQERGRGSRFHGGAPEALPSRSAKGGRSAPFPTQRSFGLSRQHQSAQAMRILEEQAAAKALQWRESIYNRNLKARPLEVGKRSMAAKDARARSERRLEPWIRRELQAVLPDSDHAFLVRLVLGLWFRTEHEPDHAVERGVGEAEAMKELRRFLGDQAALFWHELRCFAESPFTMHAYDTVVVYTREGYSRRPVGGRLASRSLNNKEPGHLESGHHTARRHSTRGAEGIQSCTGQHRKENVQSSQVRDPRTEQRTRRSHAEGIPIAEDRWQLSYC